MQKKLVMLFIAIVLAFVGLIGKITHINATNGERYTKIVLDQQQLNQQINKEKEHYVSLELLRQQINDQAKEELKKLLKK